MEKSTIVGWDGTAAADAALDWALSNRQRNSILLVQVDDDVSVGTEALLDKAQQVKKDHPQVGLTTQLVRGAPVEELARFSRGQTLLVVGAAPARRAGVRSGWSVGARLAAMVTGPIAVIPLAFDKARNGIVVGVDGSPSSQAALEFAASEAERTDQPVIAVLAWQPPPVWIDAMIPEPEYLSSLESMYGHLLDDSIAGVVNRHPSVRIIRALTAGPAHRALLEAARAAALVVVGNHGFRGLKRFFLGSVSHSVIVNASCPVVVVHAM